MLTVLDLHGDTLLAHREHEINLRLRATLRKMSQVEMRQSSKKVAGHSLVA